MNLKMKILKKYYRLMKVYKKKSIIATEQGY